MSDEQDKLAEEWAAALEAQEETENVEAAGGEPVDNDKLAEEWAAALAGDEQDDLKKEKEQRCYDAWNTNNKHNIKTNTPTYRIKF